MEFKKVNPWEILHRLSSGLSIITAIAVIFMAVQMHGLNTSLVNFMNDVGGDLVQTDNPVGGTKITGSELSNTLGSLASMVNTLKNSNIYVPLTDGTSNVPTIYNSKGESIADASSKVVYLNNGTTFTFADKVYVGTDVDILTTLKLAISTAQNGNAIVQEVKSAYEDLGAHEYLIDIIGYDNINRMYAQYSEELAKDIVESYQNQMNSSSDLEGVDKDKLNLRFAIFSDGTQINAAGCYFYFGDEKVGDNWSNCYSSWNFDGYVEIDEWSFDSSWYDIDVDEIDEATVQTALQSKLIAFYSQMNEILAKAGLLNTSDSGSTNSSESSENTEDKTTGTGDVIEVTGKPAESDNDSEKITDSNG